MSIATKIKAMFSGYMGSIEESLADTSRDGKYAIETAEKEVEEFLHKFAELKTNSIMLTKSIENAEASKVQYEKTAKKANEKGNKEDAQQCIREVVSIRSKIASLQEQLEENTKIEGVIEDQIKTYREKISSAKNKLASLEARSDSADLRQNIAKSVAGMSGSTGLAELENLEKKVLEKESSAQAFEEVAQIDGATKSVVEKYSVDEIDYEAELAALSK